MAGKKSMRRTIITIAIVVAGASLLAVGAVVLKDTLDARTIISKQILEEANFSIFYPATTEESDAAWVLQKDRTSYDKESGVLSLYVSQHSTGRQIILNEQPTPGAFADVPTQYNKMLTTLNEYNELQIGFGTVALTHPKELNGGQTAVANKAGTLMFAKPSADLTDSEWRDFFEKLRLLR